MADQHRMMSGVRADAADRDRWQVTANGRFREDMASLRADLAGRIAELDMAAAERRERQGVRFANPWAERAERLASSDMQAVRTAMHLLFLLAASFGAVAAVILLAGAFGPVIIEALTSGAGR